MIDGHVYVISGNFGEGTGDLERRQWVMAEDDLLFFDSMGLFWFRLLLQCVE